METVKGLPSSDEHPLSDKTDDVTLLKSRARSMMQAVRIVEKTGKTKTKSKYP